MMSHAYNLRIQEAEAGRIQGQPWLQTVWVIQKSPASKKSKQIDGDLGIVVRTQALLKVTSAPSSGLCLSLHQ